MILMEIKVRSVEDADRKGALNDLWEFLPSKNEWIWQNGPEECQGLGYYDGYGKPGVPEARYGALGWVDPQQENTLWLFGGMGTGVNLMNDLWRYRKGENWVWIAGNSTEEDRVYDGNVTYPGGRRWSV